jgi:hypothetical protein
MKERIKTTLFSMGYGRYLSQIIEGVRGRDGKQIIQISLLKHSHLSPGALTTLNCRITSSLYPACALFLLMQHFLL